MSGFQSAKRRCRLRERQTILLKSTFKNKKIKSKKAETNSAAALGSNVDGLSQNMERKDKWGRKERKWGDEFRRFSIQIVNVAEREKG